MRIDQAGTESTKMILTSRLSDCYRNFGLFKNLCLFYLNNRRSSISLVDGDMVANLIVDLDKVANCHDSAPRVSKIMLSISFVL